MWVGRVLCFSSTKILSHPFGSSYHFFENIEEIFLIGRLTVYQIPFSHTKSRSRILFQTVPFLDWMWPGGEEEEVWISWGRVPSKSRARSVDAFLTARIVRYLVPESNAVYVPGDRRVNPPPMGSTLNTFRGHLSLSFTGSLTPQCI